jgi:hypothetical protein
MPLQLLYGIARSYYNKIFSLCHSIRMSVGVQECSFIDP